MYIETLSKTQSITWLDNDQEAPESATALVGEMKVLIPLADLIDKDAEIARLTKDIDKRRKEYDQLTIKLANKQFVERAPESLVQTEKNRLADTVSALENLQNQLTKIKTL